MMHSPPSKPRKGDHKRQIGDEYETDALKRRRKQRRKKKNTKTPESNLLEELTTSVATVPAKLTQTGVTNEERLREVVGVEAAPNADHGVIAVGVFDAVLKKMRVRSDKELAEIEQSRDPNSDESKVSIGDVDDSLFMASGAAALHRTDDELDDEIKLQFEDHAPFHPANSHIVLPLTSDADRAFVVSTVRWVLHNRKAMKVMDIALMQAVAGMCKVASGMADAPISHMLEYASWYSKQPGYRMSESLVNTHVMRALKEDHGVTNGVELEVVKQMFAGVADPDYEPDPPFEDARAPPVADPVHASEVRANAMSAMNRKRRLTEQFRIIGTLFTAAGSAALVPVLQQIDDIFDPARGGEAIAARKPTLRKLLEVLTDPMGVIMGISYTSNRITVGNQWKRKEVVPITNARYTEAWKVLRSRIITMYG